MTREDGSCTGKKRFASFTQAEKCARQQSRRRDDAPRRAYHCRLCSGFHVGTMIVRSALREARPS